ncbi:MAG: helix-turn-helix domain-containing protein, partial [Allomuricauda sp.]
MNLIGNKISETRKTMGLTQEELAEQSHISLRTIQRIENNENEPRGKTLDLICDILQINKEELIHSKTVKEKNGIGTYSTNGIFLLALNLLLVTLIGCTTSYIGANV